jgi:hypothetical protein
LRAAKGGALALAAAVVLLPARDASAHRLDEYLQAARIAVEPDHLLLELDLTPGAAIAATIVADIDRDRDGSLSDPEQQDYARRVLADLDVAVDDRAIAVQPGTATFADTRALLRGDGTIQLRTRLAFPAQAAGAHHILFRNRYRRDISVYLANALVPESSRIGVTAQRRDAQQRDLTIEYQVHAGTSGSPVWWLFGGAAMLGAWRIINRESGIVNRE